MDVQKLRNEAPGFTTCKGRKKFENYLLASPAAAVLVSVNSPNFLSVYRPEP